MAFVALNFTTKDVEVKIQEGDISSLQAASIVSNYEGTSPSFIVDGVLKLKGYEGRLYITERR